MRKTSKLAYCAVLLALSLTVAGSAFGSDMKTTDTSAIMGSSDFNEGYAGFTQAVSTGITSADPSEVIASLDFNEGCSGLAVFQVGHAPLITGSNAILNSDFNEAYSGFSTPSVAVSGSNDAMASSTRSDRYQR